jgi:3-hydroxybutyrate dehydrogenase
MPALVRLTRRHFARTARDHKKQQYGAHMSELKGKVVVITGSTSGIGLGIAEAFAGHGAHVMLNGFGDPQHIETIRAGLAKTAGVNVAYHAADMSRASEVRDLIATTADQLGPVDVLVNNAGIQHVCPITDFPDEKWDAIIAINLSSAFHAIKAALPGMLERQWGRVINVASAHGLVASENKSAYVAAKHGVVGLTKAAALEVARRGVTVNAICPGYVLTPLVEKQIDDQARVNGIPRERVIEDIILLKQPTKKFVQISEVAALAVFLASSAGASINGTALSMDGGWVAQ